ncbi:MAG: hypothetical protein JWQ94_2554 [Tardiphaga sp.]|nr:hypothetical protein [Tardiphaga sp.]
MNRQQRRAAAKQTGRPDAAASVGALLQAGLDLHQRGRLPEAEAVYRNVLKLQPEQPDALHLLGVVANHDKRHAEAAELIGRAIAREQRNPLYFSNLGLALQALGRSDAALASFDQALALQPDFSEVHRHRGNALCELGRSGEAFASFDAALALRPDFVEVLRPYAAALYRQQSLDRALACYDRLIVAVPDDADALNERGNVLFDLKRFDEALASYEQAIVLVPNYVNAMSNRGLALLQLRRFDEAIATLERALAIAPDRAEIHNNHGNALQGLQRFDDALTAYDRAVQLKPDYAEAYNNRGNTLVYLRRFDDAVVSFQQAVAIDPDYGDAHWNEAILRLLTGDFENGWAKAEWRWKCRALGLVSRPFSQPLWLGEASIAGKTILLHSDEGLGDAIHFCRYVPLVAALGARVILQVQSSLVSLLSGLEGVTLCISLADAAPAFDVHCSLSSLPLAFKTRMPTIPSQTPYLRSGSASPFDAEAGRGLRIGIVWSGNPDHGNDLNRSIPLPLMSSLFDLPATFIPLQTEMRPGDAELLARHGNVLGLSGTFRSFSDTAAVVSQLDLVVTVDTSVAHLAGALGRPVWILLPYSPDWRWLLGRDDSPWYPTARLFRQTARRDWQQVIARVRKELGGLLVPQEALSSD